MMTREEVLKAFLTSGTAADRNTDLTVEDGEFHFMSQYTQELFEAYWEGVQRGFSTAIRKEKDDRMVEYGTG